MAVSDYLRVKRIVALLVLTVLVKEAAAQSSLANSRIDEVDWSRIRGVNYIPSYARNTYEIWRDFDAEVFDRELALAHKVGYSSIRLWLNYFAYKERGSMVQDVNTAVTLCRKHQLKAIVVLFDGCGASPKAASKLMTVSEAYDRLLSNSTLSDPLKEIVRFNYGRYAKGLGKDIQVRVSEDSSPHALLWQDWHPSPGYTQMDPDSWSSLDQYITDVIGKMAGNKTVLAWDLMNEPEWATEEPFTNGMNRAEVKTKVSHFLLHVKDVVKKQYPAETVTVGFASLDYCKE